MKTLLMILALAFSFLSTPALAQGNSTPEMVLEGIEWWKKTTKKLSDEMGPALPKFMGKIGPAAANYVAFQNNRKNYERLCTEAGLMKGQPICEALKAGTKLSPQRSALGTVFVALIYSAGSNNPQAQEALELLVALRNQLKIEPKLPSTPAYLLEGVWKQFPACFPKECRVMKNKPANSGALLNAILEYFEKYGGEEVTVAVKKLRELGYN